MSTGTTSDELHPFHPPASAEEGDPDTGVKQSQTYLNISMNENFGFIYYGEIILTFLKGKNVCTWASFQ